MKKKFKVLSVAFAVLFSLVIFAGCSPQRVLKKHSKNLTEYDISVVFCDTEKTLSCLEKVEYVNSYDSILENICFHLYPAAFSEDASIKPYAKSKIDSCFPSGINYGDIFINSVVVEGTNVDFSIVGEDNNALSVPLNNPLYQGERVTIIIDFKVKLSNSTHRLGFNNDVVNLGNWYPIAAEYSGGNFVLDPYYANGDPFYSSVSNYSVTISYPEKYTLASTGDLVESQLEDGVKTEKFTALAVRDFAMCLGTNYVTKMAMCGETMVSVFAYSQDTNIDSYLETSVNALTLFNELFGDYPYKTLNVAFTQFFQGGMEYPNLVFISDSVKELVEIKKVIVHEIAHQWWYGLVGNNEVEDAWFDEGLAEYSTLLYFENYESEGVSAETLVTDTLVNMELYYDVMSSLNIALNDRMDLRLNEYSSEYEYVYMVYVKGLLFFNDLRKTLGDDVFFKGLKEIFKEYKFKNISKEGFIACLDNVSGLDLTEYIENWLSGKIEISQN